MHWTKWRLGRKMMHYCGTYSTVQKSYAFLLLVQLFLIDTYFYDNFLHFYFSNQVKKIYVCRWTVTDSPKCLVKLVNFFIKLHKFYLRLLIIFVQKKRVVISKTDYLLVYNCCGGFCSAAALWSWSYEANVANEFWKLLTSSFALYKLYV